MRVHGPRRAASCLGVYLFVFGLPATHLSLAQSCPWWSWPLVPPPPADMSFFLLQGCSEELGEGWRTLEQGLLRCQALALESWTGSTWEGVPEKTNFRS